MSCSFNLNTCKNCPRYNGCLIQLVYANTISLKNILDSIDQKIEGISSINASKISTDDLASIKIELNGVNKALTKIEETNDERDNNVNSLQSATASIDSKLDDLIKSYNSYEYIPIINKDDSND